MGNRKLGRIALVIQDGAEPQCFNNTISSRQLINDPEDGQSLMGQSRIGMLKDKYNRLVRKYNFAFYSEEEILAPVRQFTT